MHKTLQNDLQAENELLRSELRVAREAAEITADLVVKQFEQTELEKHRYQEAAANLEGFKLTLDQTSDCVFMFDPQTYLFTYANQGGMIHTGYSEKELFSMTLADLSTDFDHAKLTEILGPLMEDPSESVFFTTTHQMKNGVDVPVEIFLQYISPEGVQGRFFTIVRNISKRLLEEKEKEQMQAKLLHTQKLESVGALAAGIAHEINTPIQYIGANLNFLGEAFSDINELLKRCSELLLALQTEEDLQPNIHSINECIEDIDLPYLQEEIPAAIGQANEGVEKVSSLVLAMKEFSHPGNKQKEQIDINRTIKTTVQVARNEWKYVADVKLDLAPDLPLIHCHANEIGQVILNLLVNAAQSIKERLDKAPNSPKGSIAISTNGIEDKIEIQIADNGKGIPPEILNKIFDPFFTTKDVGKGTGQGLAIARDVVQNKHNGMLSAVSEKGKGAVFTIHLPIFDKPAE